MALLVQRYIFWALLRNFLLMLLVVTVLTFLVMMADIGRFQDLSLSQVLSRIPYALPTRMDILLPLAILIASLLTYGRLSAANEILAIRMGGIHPAHAVMPGLVIGLILTVVALYINGSVAPDARVKVRQVTKDDLRRFLDNMEDQRVRRFVSSGIAMSWREVDEDGWLNDFFYRLEMADGSLVRGEARRAKVSFDESGDNVIIESEDLTGIFGDLTERTSTPRNTIAVPLAAMFKASPAKKARKEHMTNAELRTSIYRNSRLGVPETSKTLTKHRAEYWERVSVSFACLVFVLVGAPVGILFRRGSFVGSGLVALLIAFVLYWPLLKLGQGLVYRGGVPAGLGMFLPTGVVGLLGLALLRATFRR